MQTPASLLYIDDREEDVELLGLRLMAFGVNMEAAFTGKQALKDYDPARHCVVLIDWNLPDMDGIDVARQIIARNPDCRIAFISGLLVPAAITAANAMGIFEFFEKSLKMDHISSIAQLVRDVTMHPIRKAV